MTNLTYRPEMLKLLSEEQREWLNILSKSVLKDSERSAISLLARDALYELALTLYRLRVAQAQLVYLDQKDSWSTQVATRDINAELGIEEME